MGHTLHYLTEPVTFEREDCVNCGVTFFVTADLRKRRKQDAEWFYCPNGHAQRYSQSEADKLRAKVKEWEAYAQAVLRDTLPDEGHHTELYVSAMEAMPAWESALTERVSTDAGESHASKV